LGTTPVFQSSGVFQSPEPSIQTALITLAIVSSSQIPTETLFGGL
jgi:hypothetical protein